MLGLIESGVDRFISFRARWKVDGGDQSMVKSEFSHKEIGGKMNGT